jgi:biopolymer transport protein ExbB
MASHIRHKRAGFHNLLLAAAFAGLSSHAVAGSWWNPEWTLRKQITLDTSPQAGAIGEPVGSTAVLVRLFDGNFQFSSVKEDASDLRFVAGDDKTVLPHHIERFDPLLNEAFVWVRVPDVKPGGKTTVYLYYGNSGSKATRTDDPKGTFGDDTVLAYHFGERGAPASDSSGNNNNSQNAGLPVDGSIIGGGLRLDGKSAVTIPASPTLQWTAGSSSTWSAWIKPTSLQPDAVIFSRRDGNSSFVVGANNGVPYVEVNGKRSPGGAPLAVNSWHHLAVVAEAAKLSLYLDGASYGSLDAALPALNSPSFLGGESGAGDSGFVGEIDELEIAKVARPAGAIKLAAIGQGGEKAASLISFGAEEQPSNMMSWMNGNGTFSVLVRSLTPDGWAVICILAVMATISWWVMVGKVRYLNSISKGNALFMKFWREIASDMTVLDDADGEKMKNMGGLVDNDALKTMRSASVFRIYHIGVEEIRHRLSADREEGSRKALSGRSIQAIRASLDGGLVRETQRLNNKIVLLTICISGGPFLGLLGTVIGVMITFAAIAAAGDVNVNAIAPGIAAALLATVAGLAVAIPSLFGYNYIISRVKDATSDMHVFIDEFVTRMAEFYRE